MEDVKELIEDQFKKYASYVILDRAIPLVDDGLKPVQRMILWILHEMDDGKLHKVANVAGQTMALHPHGDAPITEALTIMANKDYLLDRQGNFGNIYTGDPPAASRYIETRLSPLARETLFNKDLTSFTPSYDGRKQRPVFLPSKIPVVLLHGIDGIAVGMSTHIFPHNFVELLEAQIAILEGKPYKILPDFPTGGIMDAREYDLGRGKVKLRAKIDIVDPKTIVIKEICYGTTTESLIRSIDEAAKKGKLKIDGIFDYTSDKVEIEIKLARGIYAEDLIDALYHYTECEVTLFSSIIVIKDNLPWETTVPEILEYLTEKLQGYLRMELEILEDRLKEKIFLKTLERIFCEKRIYKKIEEVDSLEKIFQVLHTSFAPYQKELLRIPTQEDLEKLLQLPIRKITLYDLNKNREEIEEASLELSRVQKDLKQINKVTIRYLQDLIKKYGKFYPRLTKTSKIEELDKRAIETKKVKVAFDEASGFLGTHVNSENKIECTNYDKLLLLYHDGSYKVINIPEKRYVCDKERKVLYWGIADKETVFNAVYREAKTRLGFAKRFVIKQFILDKEYRYAPEATDVLLLTTDVGDLFVQFIPKPKQKQDKIRFPLKEVLVKGVATKGVRLSSRAVKKVSLDPKSIEQPSLFS